mmetsp:Transcript_74053/g.165709  ORF Transcript_74053/g.165709 Transcript_74053/m.165709 type:complete len:554 (+) Transcript_74053:898-2559(+)
MQGQDVVGNPVVVRLIVDILNDKHHVEPRHDGRREVAVLVQRLRWLVVGVLRKDGGQDGCSGIQGRLNAGLRQGDGLLLHGFVDGHLVLLVHELKLVDATDAVVSKHQRSRLNDLLLVQVCVLHHRCSETSGRRCFAGSEDRAWEELGDPLQQGALRCRRITQDAHVDVPAQLDALIGPLRSPTEEHEQDSLLDLDVALNGRGDGLREDLEAILLATWAHVVRDLLEVILVGLREEHLVIRSHILACTQATAAPVRVLIDEGSEECQLVREVAVAEAGESPHALLRAVGRVRAGLQGAADLLLELGWTHQRWDVRHDDEASRDQHLVAWLAAIGALVADDHVDGSRHGASWNLVLVLLQPDPLPVTPARRPRVGLQGPIGAVAAVLRGAHCWHRHLELLRHTADLAPALIALERADQQLRLHLRHPRDCAADGDEPPQLVSSHVADAAVEGQVVEGDRELQLVLDGLLDLFLQVLLLDLGEELRDGCVQGVAHHHVARFDDAAEVSRLERHGACLDLLQVVDLHVQGALALLDHALGLVEVVVVALIATVGIR